MNKNEIHVSVRVTGKMSLTAKNNVHANNNLSIFVRTCGSSTRVSNRRETKENECMKVLDVSAEWMNTKAASNLLLSTNALSQSPGGISPLSCQLSQMKGWDSTGKLLFLGYAHIGNYSTMAHFSWTCTNPQELRSIWARKSTSMSTAARPVRIRQQQPGLSSMIKWTKCIEVDIFVYIM